MPFKVSASIKELVENEGKDVHIGIHFALR